MKFKVLLPFIILALCGSLLLIPQARAQLKGDINEDGKVDITDITLAASQYMVNPDDPNYNSTIISKADLAPPFNGVIDILDMVTLVHCYTG